MRSPISLRERLLGSVFIALALTVPFALWGVYGDAHFELDELYDAQLEQMGRAYLAIDATPNAEPPSVVHPYTHKILTRHVWLKRDVQVIWESEVGRLPPTLDSSEGFGDIEFNGSHWRYFGLWSQDRLHHVLMMQDHAMREDLAAQVAKRTGLLWLTHGLALVLLIALFTTLALRPLRAVVLALSGAHPLKVRLPPPGSLPSELAIVVTAFERLLERFRALLERESNFAATAAHELRTPLAGLSAQLQVLGIQSNVDPQALAQALHAVRHLSTLVDHLLLMARMENHQQQVRSELVDLHELALDMAAMVQDIWPQSDINWDIVQSTNVCWHVLGDPTLLRVVLLNLLDNACKHGSSHPCIVIRAKCLGSLRQLIVEDNGPGIPPDWMLLLQQRFTRASSKSGLGLGLALVREIVRLHGGGLTLDHAELGGLRVTITLPAQPEPA